MSYLNYHWLYNFWMVVAEGSMTAAARRMHVTQPTVSTMVSELENALGSKLLSRKGRQISLTPAGMVVHKYANEIFTLGREMENAVKSGDLDQYHAFRVGIAEVVPKILAQRLLDPILLSTPPVTLQCFNRSTSQLMASLAVHELDLVIADAPVPPAANVRAFNHLVMECGVTWVAKPEISNKLRRAFPESLARVPLLMPARGSLIRQSLELWFERSGISPTVKAEFEDTGVMKIAGAHGHGAFPVPEMIAKEVCSDYGVKTIGSIDRVRYKLYLINLGRKIKNPLVVKLMEAFQV